jgi:hypothetical protein
VPIDDNIKVQGDKVITWIPNSASPPAPEVLYVVPTFGWDRPSNKVGEESISSRRRGGGLRVYLDRPWNVSGYGEMLAVVLPSENFSGDPKYVTQWGNDPIWRSEFVQGTAPKFGDFINTRINRGTAPDANRNWLPSFAPADEADQKPGMFLYTNLWHPDIPQSTVDIAPYDVFYDDERQLWYCDIEIKLAAKSYYPFIQLALARYQPTSVLHAHLSHSVLADFMQLVPDRWLTVTKMPNQDKTWRVSVFGNTYSDSSLLKERASTIKVWVEHMDPALGEDFGWKRDDSNFQTIPSSGARIDGKLWEGIIKVTNMASLGSADMSCFRLVIGEYEKYLIDTPDPNTGQLTQERLVFIEHVILH